jgi:hypothetical protein
MGMSNEDKGLEGLQTSIKLHLDKLNGFNREVDYIPKQLKDWINVPNLELLHTTIRVKNMKILILTLLRLNKHLL